ncbi:hypothetical protein QBC37DRAFT_140516 [Rhypophila decipiens]|uniref:Uncharacterized protein n=1 Tax=Rhypophila decipiens TaxID=261697 RepID=A0AAN6Y939_9PEZI|nr:hypothetical protein QBC37DRAFT_140516 [Rhypophila decipiens]
METSLNLLLRGVFFSLAVLSAGWLGAHAKACQSPGRKRGCRPALPPHMIISVDVGERHLVHTHDTFYLAGDTRQHASRLLDPSYSTPYPCLFSGIGPFSFDWSGRPICLRT